MPKFMRSCVAAVVALVGASSMAWADPTLKVGDAAPALSVAKFVKGEPVKSFEKGKIYVVEFWATWCGPCRQSIPHLTELQKVNPDVIFIGSDVAEDEAKVAKFVTDMGEKMSYRVAIDDMSKEHGVNNAVFMDAAGQNGIPTAFVIDKDTKVAWIGHPMAMEPVLKQVVAGTYDLKRAVAEEGAKQKMMALAETRDFDGAVKAGDDAVTADPSLAGAVGAMQFDLLMAGKKDPVAAAKKVDPIIGKIDDAMVLNEIAWKLATDKTQTPETLATALKAGDASLAKMPDEPNMLDTVARVHAAQGNFAKAAEYQAKAVDKTDEARKASFGKTLAAYKAGKMPGGE